jgi:DNA polymerase III delta subunit
MKLLNDETQELGRNQKQRNGMWNKKQRPESVEAIRSKQLENWERIRSAVEQAKNPLTEERVKQIIRETVTDYIKNETQQVNNKTIDIRL